MAKGFTVKASKPRRINRTRPEWDYERLKRDGEERR